MSSLAREEREIPPEGHHSACFHHALQELVNSPSKFFSLTLKNQGVITNIQAENSNSEEAIVVRLNHTTFYKLGTCIMKLIKYYRKMLTG